MKSIWKYPIKTADVQIIEMPYGAQILDVQSQRGTPCMWALVNEHEPLTERTFEVFGTGHIIPDNNKNRAYIGTYQSHEGALIFHVFEIV